MKGPNPDCAAYYKSLTAPRRAEMYALAQELGKVKAAKKLGIALSTLCQACKKHEEQTGIPRTPVKRAKAWNKCL